LGDPQYRENQTIAIEDLAVSNMIKNHKLAQAISDGKLINADLNGSYNIMRKAVPNAFVDGIEGVSVHPTVITVK
jgi:transposase